MLAKVLVLAFVAIASCEDHGYRYKGYHHEPVQHYKHQYEHLPVKGHSEHESAHEQHYSPAPQSHGHAYSSQSIVHHTGYSGHSGQSELAGHHGAQEAHNEHVAPVYQHVDEGDAAPAHHEAPANHYQSIQFASPAPAHYEHAVHSSQVHANIHHADLHEHHSEPHYAHGHEEHSYGHSALNREAPSYHGHEEKSYGHDAVQHEAPVYHGHHAEGHSHDEPVDYYAYPKYKYEYKVEDPHTGDSKFQHEYRDGDVVKGVYSVQEPDGSVRIVEYSSDKDTGFSAIVKHTAPGQHVQIESHHEN